MPNDNLSHLELELFREFERAEMRRFEVNRGRTKRPRATTNDDVPRR